MMHRGTCKRCGKAFWESERGANGSDLCEACESMNDSYTFSRDPAHEPTYFSRPAPFAKDGHNVLWMQENARNIAAVARQNLEMACLPHSRAGDKADWMKRAVSDQKLSARQYARARELYVGVEA
jgi:hypothetical protein